MGLHTSVISMKISKSFIDQTDRPSNVIKLLKTDLNYVLCLLEIVQSHLKHLYNIFLYTAIKTNNF